ncbi:hypothetical protein PAXRUDRAFT_117105, partial [Paxillus rubicundulus Ve08.2h10]
AHCWSEEVALLFEEKCHVVQFLEWQASFWASKGDACFTSDTNLNEGLLAYAEHQVSLQHKLASSFAHTW